MYPSLEQATADYLAVSRLAIHGRVALWQPLEELAWARLDGARVRRQMAEDLAARRRLSGSAS